VARHWVNAAVHRYLIPATQTGIKIPVDTHSRAGQIHAVTRLFLPGEGCMWCNQLIDPTRLAIDMHPASEREAARYVPGVLAPSVITLNAIAAAEAVNQFMLAVTNLHHDDASTASILHPPAAVNGPSRYTGEIPTALGAHLKGYSEPANRNHQEQQAISHRWPCGTEHREIRAGPGLLHACASSVVQRFGVAASRRRPVTDRADARTKPRLGTPDVIHPYLARFV
jgi:hypothetical protein